MSSGLLGIGNPTNDWVLSAKQKETHRNCIDNDSGRSASSSFIHSTLTTRFISR